MLYFFKKKDKSVPTPKEERKKKKGGGEYKDATDRKMYTTESECDDESFNSTFPCEVLLLLLWSGDNGSTMANMTAANPVTRNWGMTIKVL